MIWSGPRRSSNEPASRPTRRGRSRPVSGATRTPPRPPWRSARCSFVSAGTRPACARCSACLHDHPNGAPRSLISWGPFVASDCRRQGPTQKPSWPPSGARSGRQRSFREAPLSLHGRYEVAEQVASSARARVLRAFDRARAEQVALKVYASSEGRSPSRSAFVRLEGDVRALQPLDHPAIVPIREFFSSGPTVVLRWMEGGTLEQMMARSPIAPARAAEIRASILSALGEAHRLGILHRDVKATNVLFDATGAARLSDFGAAHVVDASATVTAGDLGSLATLSPEQREGREVTAQSDLFAIGVLLEEMLTGARPGAAALRSLPSEAHAGMDARHDDVVSRLTARDPRSRPADAFQARDMLLSLPWPAAASPASAPERGLGERRASDRPGSDRVTRRADGSLADGWTGRAIECLPLTDEVLERARVFARADHHALQPVLRVDRDAGCLWLASCGPPIDRPLTPAERERLQGALDALQAAGGPPAQVGEGLAAVGPSGDVVVRFAAGPSDRR